MTATAPFPFAPDDVAATLAALRARRPLVHSITNLVVTNSTANALLAIGASPAMVEDAEEAGPFAAIADALVINLGTMTRARAAGMQAACASAHAAGTPWILDPVAVGVLALRSEVAVALLAHRPSAIRGNASEILALDALAAGRDAVSGRGVDSAHGSDAAREAAIRLALHTGSAVTVSGAVDLVTDGTRLVQIGNGDALMPLVTGLGCTATALVGACLAVQADPLAASVHGMVLIGLAGELAAARSRGPGSLQMELLDALHGLDAETIRSRSRIGLAG